MRYWFLLIWVIYFFDGKAQNSVGELPASFSQTGQLPEEFRSLKPTVNLGVTFPDETRGLPKVHGASRRTRKKQKKVFDEVDLVNKTLDSLTGLQPATNSLPVGGYSETTPIISTSNIPTHTNIIDKPSNNFGIMTLLTFGLLGIILFLIFRVNNPVVYNNAENNNSKTQYSGVLIIVIGVLVAGLLLHLSTELQKLDSIASATLNAIIISLIISVVYFGLLNYNRKH